MARISWQAAIRAGSWDCSHRKNEVIAANLWLRVEAQLCLPVSSQPRKSVTAAASMWSRVSFSGGTDRWPANQPIRILNVSR
jgi:hypothetical protein